MNFFKRDKLVIRDDNFEYYLTNIRDLSKKYNNTNVYVISEEFTSQICLNCKKRTKMCSELFECKFCNFSIDRDTRKYKYIRKIL
jgi:transposase